MSPRPLYRWKSFWLGVLVLGSLGWAWSDSYRYTSALVSPRQGAAWSEGGRLGVSWESLNFDKLHLEVWRDPLFEDEIGVRFSELPTRSLAYWFLLLLFSLSWSAWLFWHWKREQKKSS